MTMAFSGAAAFVGMTERGPLAGTPEPVYSFAEFQRRFGGFLPVDVYHERRYLPMAVEQFFQNGGRCCYIVRLLDETDARASSARVGAALFEASSVGAWGDRVEVSCKMGAANGDYTLRVLCRDSVGNKNTAVEEIYENITLNPASDQFLGGLLEASVLLRAAFDPQQLSVRALYDAFALTGSRSGGWLTVRLSGGADCPQGEAPFARLTAELLRGADNGAGNSRGLFALADIPEISTVAAPGFTAPEEISELVAHCEMMGNRFCILDTPGEMRDPTQLLAFRAQVDSTLAAIYTPWLQGFDYVARHTCFVPPSGAVSGVFARIGAAGGVHHSYADGIVQTSSLRFYFGKREQDALLPAGVNLICRTLGVGMCVWGASTCSSDPAWSSIHARRLVIQLELQIRRALEWTAGKPNDEQLWNRACEDVRGILESLRLAGVLAGEKPEESYYVAAGRETMTPQEIQRGQFVCEVGAAFQNPGEISAFRVALDLSAF